MQTANQPAESAGETDLLNQTIQVERKHITFDVAENPRGWFLRITEQVGAHRNAIIVPPSGIEAFRDAVNNVIEFSKPSARPVLPQPSVPQKST